MRAALYRHYDAEGRLLYIGVTTDPDRRTGQHRRYSGWADKIDATLVQWFDDRTDALAAEARAIATESPAHNRGKAREYRGCVHPELLADIEAFCGVRGIGFATFGSEALRDPCFVGNLRNGRELRRDTIAAVRRYMVTGQPRQRDAEATA